MYKTPQNTKITPVYKAAAKGIKAAPTPAKMIKKAIPATRVKVPKMRNMA